MEERRSKRRVNSKIWLLLGGLIVLCVLVITAGYFFIPQVKLNGKYEVVLNYKEKYKEKGYEARYLNKDVTKDVEVSGKVNSNKLGTYYIT